MMEKNQETGGRKKDESSTIATNRRVIVRDKAMVKQGIRSPRAGGARREVYFQFQKTTKKQAPTN